jgi:5-methylcytosine-specific restriction enzyme subunit McrC
MGLNHFANPLWLRVTRRALDIARYQIREASHAQVLELPRDLAVELARLRIAQLTPTDIDNLWVVSGVSKVGAVQILGHEILIRPKISIQSLFYLLGYENRQQFWRDEAVHLDAQEDVVAAMAHTLVRLVGRATRNGLLKGYRHREESAATLRGRWGVTEQIRRHAGMPVPIEISFDDFTVDTVENRILFSALRRMLMVPNVRERERRLLRRLQQRFEGVAFLAPGAQIPEVQTTRLNDHYLPALALAKLVLGGSSFAHDDGVGQGSGFLVTLSSVYEDFVTDRLSHYYGEIGGEVKSQTTTELDTNGRARIRPDILFSQAGKVRAVIDAKYKVEKPEGFPNADIYQAIVYAIKHGLSESHLIYAKGEGEPAIYEVVEAGVTVYCHALDLSATPENLEQQIKALTRRISNLQIVAAV